MGIPPSTALSGEYLLGGDLRVHRMGFGAMRITGGWVWGEPADPAGARSLLRRAVELGVDFIDTADSYGPEVSERLICEALHPYRGIVIATKGGLVRPAAQSWVPDGRPERLVTCVEDSLRRLRLGRIDLYQFHRIDPKVPLEDSLGALKRMQEAGKIRHVGVSNVSVAEIARAREVVKIVSVQNRYSLADRRGEDVVQYCETNGIAFIPWFPIAAGSLMREGNPLERIARRNQATVAQLALAWLLQKSPVILPIPGTSSVAHLEENIGASSLRLTFREWGEVERMASF